MERSLRTIRTLKIVLPILFISFIALIWAFYSGGTAPTGDGIQTTTRPERDGEQPRLVSYEFEDTQTVGDRVISRIRAGKTAGFDSGWYTLDNVELDIFRKSGGVYTLTAPSAEFNAETKEARAEGGVNVTSGDGLDLRTEAIIFDGRRLTNRVPVNFRMNQWSGTARGADLDVENETMQLNGGVDASFAGEKSESIDMRSESATFDRAQGTAVFEKDVVLVRAGDTYDSERIMAQVDQSRKKLIALQGSGGVVVTIAPGSDLAPPGNQDMDGQKRITAGEFAGSFDGAGQMNAVEIFNANGQVKVELLDDVERVAKANSARLGLGAAGAESIVLFGNVTLDERTDLRRKMSAERLVITLDQATGDATTAVFDGNIRYSDVTNQATAQRVFYDLREDTVRFLGGSGVGSDDLERPAADQRR